MLHGTPLFEPQPYRGATDKRRFYEEVTIPRNLVVLGDAVAVLNPSYGQGMSTAALQAQALQRQLQVNVDRVSSRVWVP
jgi:2-polyprenyl-6-methoxyphenol hydroxylase-like FAD-dependent oxidoreductase